ncbi:MAG: secondary thiamine-phosphate synthase enzyme YjbQ, partial [Spirochaetia bacterium]
SISTSQNSEFKNITQQIAAVVSDSGISDGMCNLFVPHTTAAVTINESADPAVRKDILKELDKIVPLRDNYSHSEGNSAAHIKSSMIGVSLNIPVRDGRLYLGTWQAVYFCEFDGPRSRKIEASVYPAQ